MRNSVKTKGKKEAVVKKTTGKNNRALIDALFTLGHRWCVICGDTSKLSFSHLFKDNHMKGNPRWDYDNIQNGVMMCIPCHSQFDACANTMDLNVVTTRTGFLLLKMKDTAYAKRAVNRMFYLMNGRGRQEKIHEDISNDTN